MSFMFHPFPYSDPTAINHIDEPAEIKREMSIGVVAVAKAIAGLVRNGQRRVGIDGYAGAQFEVLVRVLYQLLGSVDIQFIPSHTFLKESRAIDSIIARSLPEDRDLDPTLLYGVRFEGGYEEFQDAGKVSTLKNTLSKSQTSIVVYGQGALCTELRGMYDLRVWFDITPQQSVLNFKYGKAANLGSDKPMSYAAVMRRNYYCDFELAAGVRWDLIRRNEIDFYISGDNPEKMKMMPYTTLIALFDKLMKRPLRCRPVYLEGVWGGYFFKRLRHLPEEMRNCAWIFDMIPLEVSLVADMGGEQFETPFFTFVQVQGEKLLGKKAFKQFGGYFPIRFNYDDTYHSSGNMSIQCHPDGTYMIENHKELGRQDESYYICVAGQEACTYLGFRADGDRDKFLEDANSAVKTGKLIDYRKYLHKVPSKPGTQLLIPAGTIHASGRNQVVLEIGSLTVGSYTYKLYDYQRIDPQTGLPRPIHLKMGEKVLRAAQSSEWVEENLVNHGRTVREGEGYRELIVGEHELLYFSLHNLVFEKEIIDDTGGTFHVLALVEGERARVESVKSPSFYYIFNFLEIVIVPANFGEYRIINEGVGTVVVHKTILKE